jgi:hypothetical protein
VDETEKAFRNGLREHGDKYIDRPEIGLKYALWLQGKARFADAAIIVKTALEEGPRFDLYESRALTTLAELEDLWIALHKALERVPEKSGGEIYNENLNAAPVDWAAVLQKITG